MSLPFLMLGQSALEEGAFAWAQVQPVMVGQLWISTSKGGRTGGRARQWCNPQSIPHSDPLSFPQLPNSATAEDQVSHHRVGVIYI